MSQLRTAVDALVAVAEQAGIPAEAAREEAMSFAAAIAEAAPRAAADWAAAQADSGGLAGSEAHQIHTAFFDAASRGRRYRVGATTLLRHLLDTASTHATAYATALTEVASAAASLGEPTMRVTATAAGAAAAQLQAASPTGGAPPDARSLPPWPATAGMPPVWPTPTLSPLPGDGSPRTDGATNGTGPAPVATAGNGVPAPAPEVPAEPVKSLDELLAELDAMIGLERVKREVHQQVAMLQIDAKRTAAGLKSPDLTRHLVFVGNPGTGKTTVARMIGGIYRALGLLPTGQLIEVDRSELVAGYLGQTAIKTAETCAKAYGGVLFIDEAYSLSGDQYGQEAVNTLVKEMEDHRDDLVVIVAGYPDPMVVFIAQNPGLASRFKTVIEFEDYSDDEIVAILRKLAAAGDYDVTDPAITYFREVLAATPRDQSFGNGRFARNHLENAIARQAWRLHSVSDPTEAQLRELLEQDFRSDEATPEATDEATEDSAAPTDASDATEQGDQA
jgi:Cdc6-like AAA superfamily ATPase